MANFKRKRPRTSGSGGYSGNGLKHRLGDRFDDRMWYGSYPRCWDKVHHTRPTRAKAHRLEKAVTSGADSENMVWPDGRKPHIYYW